MYRESKNIKILKFEVNVDSEDNSTVTFCGKLLRETSIGWYIQPRHGRNEILIPRKIITGPPIEVPRFEFTPLLGQLIRIRLIDDNPNDGFATGWMEVICLDVKDDYMKCLIEQNGNVVRMETDKVVCEPASMSIRDIRWGEKVLGYIPIIDDYWEWRECTVSRLQGHNITFTYSHEGNGGTYTQSMLAAKFIYRQCLWS